MELVEGPTLASPLPLETALQYARQIAEALEAAHDKGIVHRDLKPANIKVTPDGVVKVLDFGLAKSVDEEPRTGSIQDSPTMTLSASRTGMMLGTAADMSPEQSMADVRRGEHQPAVSADTPKRLFAVPISGPFNRGLNPGRSWDVTSDGQKFLIAGPATQ